MPKKHSQRSERLSPEDLVVDFTHRDITIEVSPKQTRSGGFEWSYRFARTYEYGGEKRQAYFFRREHDQLIAEALAFARQWMNQYEVNAWVREQLKGG